MQDLIHSNCPPKEITTEHFVMLRGRKYAYTIRRIDDGTAYIRCDAADVHRKADTQTFFNIITHLPQKILKAREEKKPVSKKTLHFRVTSDDKQIIEKEAFERGYPSVSAYLRALALGDTTQTRPYGFY